MNFTTQTIEFNSRQFSLAKIPNFVVEIKSYSSPALGADLIPFYNWTSFTANNNGDGLIVLPVYDDGTTALKYKCRFKRDAEYTTFNFNLVKTIGNQQLGTLKNIINQTAPLTDPVMAAINDAVGAALGLAIAVTNGDGDIFNIPVTAQRTVPVTNGDGDIFYLGLV